MNVEQIIEEARKSGSTELHLDRKGITKLPSEIGGLVKLRELYLRGNSLEELPPEIGQLVSLNSIYLQSNRLRFLPPEFCSLTGLDLIELYGNCLEELPDRFSQLINLTTLLLDANRFTIFPPSLSGMQKLGRLYLSANSIREIPASLEALTSLTFLNLARNALQYLPPAVRGWRRLAHIHLTENELVELPAEIGSLENLRYLDLAHNHLRSLPPEIGRLRQLAYLSVASNNLTKLPAELGLLTSLGDLYLKGNKELTALPAELGNLEQLSRIDLDDNQLSTPPPEVTKQGARAMLAYLRAQLKESQQQWTAKLILVGEGGVGKTSLLRALLSEPLDTQESTTRGIAIRPLPLQHPSIGGVEMMLNAWDFGGQEIYHATHQFFLTNRSVFVVSWNARLGFEQSKLYYWLDMIQALAPDSPILLVATHLDQRDGDLPLVDLCNKYRQIRGHWRVSNATGEGIDDLRKGISVAAASLPLMGETWPGAWLRAAQSIRRCQENFFSPAEMKSLMTKCGVAGPEQNILANWLHELGDILFFQDDDELRDIVILKPEWVTRSISKVLESERLIRELGIFTRDEMNDVWSDIEPKMRDHLLRLRERFDISYRTLENREISIVVERLRHDPPAGCQELWNSLESEPGTKEISMMFRFGSTLPAGMPTWFIARSHRFTTHTHWRYGAIFADGSGRKHVALVEASRHERCIGLAVRGRQPQNFFALLREGLEVTIGRFPGIRVVRTIPCPCSSAGGAPCTYEFNLEYLERATEQSPPILDVQCERSFKTVSVMGLLFGIHWRMQDAVLTEIEAMRGDVGELIELVQREFLSNFRRDQSVIDSHCPNVFTIRPIGSIQTLTGSYAKTLKDEWFAQEVELQLYCQAPGHWHPTHEGGRYTVRNFASWVRTVVPYLSQLLSILKYSAKIKSGLTVDVKFKEYISYMGKLVDHTLDVPSSGDLEHPVDSAHGADLRAVHAFLDSVDPSHEWGNLVKVLTPEGHYMWLCKEHADEYRR